METARASHRFDRSHSRLELLCVPVSIRADGSKRGDAQHNEFHEHDSCTVFVHHTNKRIIALVVGHGERRRVQLIETHHEVGECGDGKCRANEHQDDVKRIRSLPELFHTLAMRRDDCRASR